MKHLKKTVIHIALVVFCFWQTSLVASNKKEVRKPGKLRRSMSLDTGAKYLSKERGRHESLAESITHIRNYRAIQERFVDNEPGIFSFLMDLFGF